MRLGLKIGVTVDKPLEIAPDTAVGIESVVGSDGAVVAFGDDPSPGMSISSGYHAEGRGMEEDHSFVDQRGISLSSLSFLPSPSCASIPKSTSILASLSTTIEAPAP